MKSLLVTAILLATSLSFANPTGYGTVSGTISISDWTEIVSSATKGATKVMVSHTGVSFLSIGRGVSGSIVETGMLIAPTQTPVLTPMSINKGDKLWLKSLHRPFSGVAGIVFFQ